MDRNCRADDGFAARTQVAGIDGESEEIGGREGREEHLCKSDR